MTDEQTAKKDRIVAACIVESFMDQCNVESCEDRIVRALQQARTPPPGHIIDDQGVVRRVLGTLVLTADGCVWAHGAKVYWHEDPHEQSLENINDDIAFFEEHGTDADGEVCGTWEKVSQCYSTRESAEAAKEEKK